MLLVGCDHSSTDAEKDKRNSAKNIMSGEYDDESAFSSGEMEIKEDQRAADIYKDILLGNFSEKDYYCVFDLNNDGVYEIAATSEHPDDIGRFKSLIAYFDINDGTVKYITFNTSQQIGFSQGYGQEAGKLLVRTGHEGVHHYAFSIQDSGLNVSDFLVLDYIIGNADKSEDKDRYTQYVNQDRGEFSDLIMWRIADENLERDFTGNVNANEDAYEIIEGYLQALPVEHSLGFYDHFVDDIFSHGYGRIAETYGEPLGKVVKCILRKDDNREVLQYVTGYLWCNNGHGFYATEYETEFKHGPTPRNLENYVNDGKVQDINLYYSTGKIDMMSGTLDSFFNVYEEGYSLSELQNMMESPFYRNPLDDEFNVVFSLNGHTFYIAADLEQNMVKRDSQVKVFNTPCDTSNYELLFDEDGNIKDISY